MPLHAVTLRAVTPRSVTPRSVTPRAVMPHGVTARVVQRVAGGAGWVIQSHPSHSRMYWTPPHDIDMQAVGVHTRNKRLEVHRSKSGFAGMLVSVHLRVVWDVWDPPLLSLRVVAGDDGEQVGHGRRRRYRRWVRSSRELGQLGHQHTRVAGMDFPVVLGHGEAVERQSLLLIRVAATGAPVVVGLGRPSGVVNRFPARMVGLWLWTVFPMVPAVFQLSHPRPVRPLASAEAPP